MAQPLQVPPAQAKREGSPPYVLYAAIVVVVGGSAALSAGLLLEANREQPTAVASGAEAGAAQAAPLPSVAAHSAPTELEDAGSASATATATAEPAPKPSATAKPVASADATGPGFLTIRTSPPARVTERGRVLCTTTPCAKLPLPPGAHVLTLENKDEALKNSIVVNITSGETTSKKVTLK